MATFTATQGRYLAYIHAYMEAFGEAPSEAEIAEAIRVSPPSVNQMIKTLQKKELIRRQPGVPRSIEILVPETDIPEWENKTVTRFLRGWMPINAPRVQVAQVQPTQPVKGSIYRFKITLRDFKPQIWRRIEVQDMPLSRFHLVLQQAMGWSNCHLHQFVIDDTYYAPRELVEDGCDDMQAYEKVKISDLVPAGKKKFRCRYDYDFGDGWEHDLVLEAADAPKPGQKYPLCLEGARACPPEDIGGVWGYADYLAALKNPDSPEFDDFVEGYGKIDPNQFDAAKTTLRMRQLKSFVY